MAQLRDAHTSTLIAEGTPTALVSIADELGIKAGVVGIDQTADDLGLDAIYDDVGLGFDPDAVRQARDENIDGLKAASTIKATPDKEQRASIKTSYDAAVAEVEDAKAAAPQAQERLDAARAAVES